MADIKNLVYRLISQQKLGVVSTVNGKSKPEAALVGIAVSENFEIIFDTIKTSRKIQQHLTKPQSSIGDRLG